MNSCTYHKRDSDGFCICKGVDVVGSLKKKRQKRYDDYMCRGAF